MAKRQNSKFCEWEFESLRDYMKDKEHHSARFIETSPGIFETYQVANNYHRSRSFKTYKEAIDFVEEQRIKYEEDKPLWREDYFYRITKVVTIIVNVNGEIKNALE